jgi:hypothetical protein
VRGVSPSSAPIVIAPVEAPVVPLVTPAAMGTVTEVVGGRVIFEGGTDKGFRKGVRVQILSQRKVPKPDLVLYLTAPVDVLMERIAARGRDYERSITADYLAELDLRYRSYFASYTDAPVLIVDTTRIDFRDAAQLEQLMARMATGQGGELDADSLGQLPLEQFAARLEVER